MQADLLHVKLVLSISFPAGKVILVSLQLLPLLLHASLHLLLLLLHSLKHLHIRISHYTDRKKTEGREGQAREFCVTERPDRSSLCHMRPLCTHQHNVLTASQLNR